MAITERHTVSKHIQELTASHHKRKQKNNGNDTMKRYISDKEKNYAKEKNNNLNSY